METNFMSYLNPHGLLRDMKNNLTFSQHSNENDPQDTKAMTLTTTNQQQSHYTLKRSISSSQFDLYQWQRRMENAQQESSANTMELIQSQPLKYGDGFQFEPYHRSKHTNKNTKKKTEKRTNNMKPLQNNKDKHHSLHTQYARIKSRHNTSMDQEQSQFEVKTSNDSKKIPAPPTDNHLSKDVVHGNKIQAKTTQKDTAMQSHPRQHSHTTQPSIQAALTDNRLQSEFDFDSVDWSIKLVEHFIKLFQKGKRIDDVL
jgi:hypothetical protein